MLPETLSCGLKLAQNKQQNALKPDPAAFFREFFLNAADFRDSVLTAMISAHLLPAKMVHSIWKFKELANWAIKADLRLLVHPNDLQGQELSGFENNPSSLVQISRRS